MTLARLSKAVGLAILLANSSPLFAQSITGPAEAIDGDTLSFTGIRVRLSGIDAVELKQSCLRSGQEWNCGEDARVVLAQLIDGKQLSCTGHETDIYGRIVAHCRAGSLDLGEEMVSAGLATAYVEYSSEYADQEVRAKQARLGIWASEFIPPAQWRAAHPSAAPKAEQIAATSAPAPVRVYRDSLGRCAIKGNHSRKGEWIYHLPGQAYYNQTRAEEVFCTEEDAIQAGYRRSKV